MELAVEAGLSFDSDQTFAFRPLKKLQRITCIEKTTNIFLESTIRQLLRYYAGKDS